MGGEGHDFLCVSAYLSRTSYAFFFFLSSFFVILHATKVRNNCFGENAISDGNNLRCVFRPTLRTAFNIARLLLVRWPRLRFSLSLSFSPVFHSFPVEKGRERVAQMAFYSCLAGDTVLCHDRRSMRCRNVIDTFCHVWSGGMIIYTMRRVMVMVRCTRRCYRRLR